MLLETTQKYAVNSESAAKDLIETYRAQANEKGYTIKKAGYEYKTKKAKGEIIGEKWVVTVVQIFADLWSDLDE
jgi:hypothetical protein